MTGQSGNTRTFEEVYETCCEYFHGNAVAAMDWMKKCAVKSETGIFHERSPDDGFHRVARELAIIEKNYPKPLPEEHIFDLLKDFRYIIPSVRLLLKTGNPFWNGLLSDSFVISQEEFDYSSRLIPKAHEEIAFLMRNMAAVGIDLSFVPPLYHPVGRGILLSQGLTGAVKQLSSYYDDYNTPLCSGKPGFSIRLDHPDLTGLIDAFMAHEIVPRAEITVRVRDADMKSEKRLQKVADWIHKSADPVIAFEDNILCDSLPDSYLEEGFGNCSFVPLSSLPLSANECVHPLCLNLYSYVDRPFTSKARVNEGAFIEHIQLAVRLADDFVDLEIRRIDQILHSIVTDFKNREVRLREENVLRRIREKLFSGRRLSIGVTGYADMLAALGLRYGSEEALQITEAVFQKLAVESFRASAQLANERGAFPAFRPEPERNYNYINRLKELDPELVDRMMADGRRNIAILAAGNCNDLTRMSGVSHKLQPIFFPFFLRRKKLGSENAQKGYDFIDEDGTKWKNQFELHPGFRHFLEANGHSWKEISTFNEKQLHGFYTGSPYYKATCKDLGAREQILTLAKVQTWTDQNVRHTVTLKTKTTAGEIAEVIRSAHRCGVKTLYIYREGFFMDTLHSET